ncbi:hypothetical protein V1292_003126 [Bradyrhizobium sp. AZCC 1719]
MMFEQADRRNHPAAGGCGNAAIDEIGRQMYGDEGELEAAREEAEHQQHVGAMTERFRQRGLEGLLLGGRRIGRCCGWWRCQRQRQRHDKEHQCRKYNERCLPAELIDNGHAEGSEQELAERTSSRAGAERETAPFRRQQLAER